MLDDKMKPWLIEVNSSPALGLETPTDRLVKPGLLRDTLGLTHFEPYSEYKVRPLFPFLLLLEIQMQILIQILAPIFQINIFQPP